jgi:hypothetical protein|tara:strand:+ start:561 stop:773 length:213 start_codon:yes stop_codon:yes gene_type:complete
MIDKGKRTKPGKNITKKKKPGKRGNPAVVETYEDARENAMINRNVPTMKEGGYCRGAGAAIKGTKFEGVF